MSVEIKVVYGLDIDIHSDSSVFFFKVCLMEDGRSKIYLVLSNIPSSHSSVNRKLIKIPFKLERITFNLLMYANTFNLFMHKRNVIDK